MIERFNIFITVVDIKMRSATVYIFSFELAAVMIDRAFTDHCTYRSLHFITSNLQNFTVLGSVTLVKSNAKALLTGEPIKNATCKQVLRSPKGKEPPLKRHSLHTPLNFCCDKP